MREGYDHENAEIAYGLTRQLLSQLSGNSQDEHNPSERDLLRAGTALSGGFSILDEWTVWAMRLPFIPTYCVPAYDGKSAAVVWENAQGWSVMLLPSMEVILEGALDIGAPIFAPGMREPYLLYLTKGGWKLRLGWEEFALEVGPKNGGSGVEIAHVINNDDACFVLLRDQPHTSWWHRLMPNMTAVQVAPSPSMSERHDRHIPVNEEYITSLPEGWDTFDLVVNGNGRVLGTVVTWDKAKDDRSTLVPTSTVHDLTAGAVIGVWKDINIDVLSDTPSGIIAFGGDRNHHLVGVSPCLALGYDELESPEGYGNECYVSSEGGLLTWFANGEIVCLTEQDERWYQVHADLKGTVLSADRVIGCVCEESNKRTSIVSLFVIPPPDP